VTNQDKNTETITRSVMHAHDAQADNELLDTINMNDAQTLDELFRERVRRSPERTAYAQFNTTNKEWESFTWADVATHVERWQVAFRESGLYKGDRVAICHRNSLDWVVFDQAALRLGLVVVPLYMSDRPDNTAYVVGHSGAKLVLFSDRNIWDQVSAAGENVACVNKVVVTQGDSDDIVQNLNDWLPEHGQHFERGVAEPDDLASIVYTSGTTGRPKGVMLSHRNMLSNAYNALRSVAITPDDQLLSFLPLSHTFERTVGYYAAMLGGAQVTYNRSIPELANDLKVVRPTIMITVPRIFERVSNQIYASVNSMSSFKRFLFKKALSIGWRNFEYKQGIDSWHPSLLFAGVLDHLVAKPVRERLGGKLIMAVVGGAPLSQDISKTFISLGIPLLQGYGLTEFSPVVSTNTVERNRPDSIGLPLRGVEVKLIENDELCVKGESIMMGYWNNDKATKKCIIEGQTGRWLRTGDRASIDTQGFIRIIGRIKDILVLANGEKVPPSDIEASIARDALFEQILLVGEGRSFLSVLVVLNPELWADFAKENGWTDEEILNPKVRKKLLARITKQMIGYPGYARIRSVYPMLDEWTVNDGLLTPTLKLKRSKIIDAYQDEITQMYAAYAKRNV